MITQINISNFKCFNALSLRLAPLTLLTGFNAAGKSTVLQSILLLSQALRAGNTFPELPLNGPLVRLGTPGETLNAGSGEIVFQIENNSSKISWFMVAKDRTKISTMQIHRINIQTQKGSEEYSNITKLESLLPAGYNEDAVELTEYLRNVIFISAVRQGTADVFPSPENTDPIHADVGIQGEFAPWWFERFLDEDINTALCNPNDPAKTLRRQYNAWSSELFPNSQGNVQRIDKTNLVRLELRIGSIGDWRRPSNIGYGLTYAFPIIIAGLLAKRGQILIIDSPEAHLHPFGQSQIGQFLAKVAMNGVQVIIETHSDHILNGIRLSVRDKIIDSSNVAIHFFDHPDYSPKAIPNVVSPLIDLNGNLSEWPSGFFDQSEKDLASLAGWL